MDDFQTVKLIGKGTFGSVYKCLNRKNKKYYAVKKIKVLKQSLSDNRGTLNELHILFYNNCPFILKFFSCFFDGYEINLMTKFCSKGDLNKTIIKKCKTCDYFLEKEIWKIFIQTCYAIHYLHKNNIIHRDLKTANIFLEKDYNIKLGDFGISKILYNTDLTSTQIGTPLYLSPELVKKKSYGLKTDMWSLGCILYELLTLRPAFDSSNINSLYQKISNAKYIKINNRNNYDSKLIDIVKDLIVVDEKNRFSIQKLLEKEIIKDKMYIAPYYDITKIEGKEIPVIKCEIPTSISSWRSVYNLYKKREKNYTTPKVNDNLKEFNFNKNKPLPSIIIKDTYKENMNKEDTEKIKLETKESTEKLNKEISKIIKSNSYQKNLNKYSCLPSILDIDKSIKSLKKDNKKNKIKQNYISHYKREYSPLNPVKAYTPRYARKNDYTKMNHKYHNLPKKPKNNYIFTNNLYSDYYKDDIRENILMKIGSKHDKNYNNPFSRY